ncbi:chromodomain-helicase-DNA-binding protein Mi-2 homolog [Olea europaea var. sylvestris]|uniref:Chromodomain-helicase-DNA-binding 5-like isoform X1 n=2 Tax=Olea europaea subsp. europaea TaxID=158383 RepID=A0A8S0Q628_OLEEU|nr:chromodomain-helicase-DNA-binding protein Mi-2 homolog [Olea europaea var. sylvestris]XP_022893640.1 chromodomain-helicase-DNA-binding protein Mi-2 homolog [Olea europaea var. sylvestris]XP_022893642.1 chromodomain-helicase-DNA-binding protein Mi-2 homolog [Olea europaea var. sylvestris]CAA2961880.1 chromodomain-helicase-DNA-binding 5-like isoform X1 [Olea europaea subsp. europaea]
MARRGNLGYKRNTRCRDQLDGKGSDDSDEDYKVGEDDDFNETEDEYCSSLAEDESEESLGEFEEEEEDEWIEKKVKHSRRPRGRKGSSGKKINGAVKPKRKKVVVYSEEEEDDDSDDNFASTKGRKRRRVSYKEEEEEEEEDEIEVSYREADNDPRPRKKTMVSYKEDNDDFDDEMPRKKTKFSNGEKKEDIEYDYSDDDDDDDDDEEFLPDEIDGIDDEEELPVTMKTKMGRVSMEEKGILKGRRKGRNAKFMKKTKRKKSVKKQVSVRKVRSDHGKDFRDDNQIVQKNKITEWGRSRRGKSTSNSDSDFVSSGSSDHEYTISEEEREQIREASEFCRRLRCSNSKTIEEKLILPPQRKRAVRKGKGKVEGVEVEAGKQVCGICLSEEGKRTVRGTLNCCSHYFCFSCIMEWSKVESSCPLCKQRFSTISRTARADAGLGLRTQVITVPERDQVYQPSEEERRGYHDPYENVLCIECQQGGDDALMLLCDLCDSPAHAYCVGLGHEVPEGNWYCDGCRPTALASSGAQGLNPSVDHGASNNLSIGSSPVASLRETFDLNELYVPDTPLPQGTEHSVSSRLSVGNFQAASTATGTGAATVFERRRIQRQIYQLLNYRSRQSDRTDGMATVSGNSLFGTQVGGRELVPGYTVTPTRMAPQNIYLQQSLLENTALPLHPREVFSPRFSSLREQSLHSQASTSADYSFGGMSHGEFIGISDRVGLGQGHQQLHPCSSRSDISTDVGISNPFREATTPSRTLQGSLRTPF